MSPERSQSWLFLALTLALVGYFAPWLPHEAAGLRFIGLEMGEQAKFLPQVRSGAIIVSRSLFYVPPISIAAILILVSSRWPNRRWQTWAVRLLALAVSLLAFPAFEALGAEAAEWLWRVLLIALVLILALLSPILGRLSTIQIWMLIAAVGVAGAVLPTWVFLEVRSAYAHLIQRPIGLGYGVWLNGTGHLLATMIAVWAMRRPTQFS